MDKMEIMYDQIKMSPKKRELKDRLDRPDSPSVLDANRGNRVAEGNKLGAYQKHVRFDEIKRMHNDSPLKSYKNKYTVPYSFANKRND
jgi:hypothetical protein